MGIPHADGGRRVECGGKLRRDYVERPGITVWFPARGGCILKKVA